MTHFKQFHTYNGDMIMVNTLNINTVRVLKGEREMPIDPNINHPILSKMPKPREDLTYLYVMLTFNNGEQLNSIQFDAHDDAEMYMMRFTDSLRFLK